MHGAQMNIIHIVEKASLIKERLAGKFESTEAPGDAQQIQKRLKKWSRGRWEEFRKRLALDGLDEAAVRPVLGRVRLSAGTPLPGWAETLSGIVDSLGAFRRERESDRHAAPESLFPFAEVYLVFVDYAREKLMERTRFSYGKLTESCLRMMERDLLNRLKYCADSTLLREFFMLSDPIQISFLKPAQVPSVSVYSSEYQAFINRLLKGGLVQVFYKYPVLARLLATVTNFWIEAHAELLIRLQTDWAAMSTAFHNSFDPGKVAGIAYAGSCYSEEGRTVLALTFDSGLKIIYKPRDPGVEEEFFKLLSWISDQSADLRIKGPKYLNRGDYGWVEFVKPVPCSSRREMSRYCRRMGMLLAILYCMELKDAHRTNVIGSGEYPVLIDAEILMCPKHSLADNSTAYGQAHEEFQDSVLGSSLLPLYDEREEGSRLDVSALEVDSSGESTIQGTSQERGDSDPMRSAYNARPLKLQSVSHDKRNGTLFEHRAEIVAGLEWMYRFLIKRRQHILDPGGPLKGFAERRVRYVLRPTRAYCEMAEIFVRPHYFRDGADFSIALDLLCPPPGGFEAPEEHTRKHWPLRKAELQALAQLDIPVFSASPGSLDFKPYPGQTIYGFFKESGYNRAVDRLNQMNEQDLERQIGYIRAALHLSSPYEQVPPPQLEAGMQRETVPLLEESGLVAEAVGIWEQLELRAIRASDGSASWIGTQLTPGHHLNRVGPVNYSLYDGCTGIGLFLAALAKVTHSAKCRTLALAAIKTLRDIIRRHPSNNKAGGVSIGGATGLGGILYALSLAGRFLDDSSLIEDALTAASYITHERIALDQRLDILSGSAGTLLGLSALYRLSRERGILNQALECGRHLVKKMKPRYSNSSKGGGLRRFPKGFFCGPWGVAYSLLNLYEITGQDAFLQGARAWLALEKIAFSQDGNLRGLEAEGVAAGTPAFAKMWGGRPLEVGIASLACSKLLSPAEMRMKIDRAINATLGAAGRLELLNAASMRLNCSELRQSGLEWASLMVARDQQSRGDPLYEGSPLWGYNPGFYTGASGIGYQFIRLAYPESLPSILLWDM